MLDRNKDSIISEICDEYKMAKMLGDNPSIQDYIKRCPPEYAQELRQDIEDWEWLVGYKYMDSAEKEVSQGQVEDLIRRIQPQLDVIDKEKQVDSVELKVSDKIIEFPRLRAVGAMGQSEDKTLRKAARSRDEEVPEYGETQLLSDNRGVIYTDTSSGHLCVQLIGPPEKTAGLRLALCEKKPDGSWRTCLEEKTNKLGIADFGRIDDIPRPQFEQVYTLLIEKTADSGSED